jgi:hypothetical protein
MIIKTISKSTSVVVSAATAATTTTTTGRRRSTLSLSDTDDDDGTDTITIKERIDNATQGLPSSNCFNYLFDRVLPTSSRGKENALTICDYISSMKSEINPSDHYRKDTIISL